MIEIFSGNVTYVHMYMWTLDTMPFLSVKDAAVIIKRKNQLKKRRFYA